MRRARAELLGPLVGSLWLLLAAAARAQGAPDPCSGAATVSPCFDADPMWLPTGPTPFAAVPSARVLDARVLSLALGVDLSDRPVVLVTPSPHPSGQELDVVRATSTLTLAARYGLGRGLDVGLALPFVPYQTGTGTGAITEQQSARLTAVTLRDPRVSLAAALFGRPERDPLALATHLELALPLGDEQALAGAPGPTLAPGFTGELTLGPLDAAVDLGLRLRRAVAFGSVREGSALTAAVAASVELLRAPALAVGAELWLSPTLASRPARAPRDTLDLPGEWLATLRLEPAPNWSLVAGAGSGLPLSKVREPGLGTSSALGVTSPDVRAVAVGRLTLR